MTSVIIAVPAMYADHHVAEVRQLLLAVPGVTDVYASSAFRVVEIQFDADEVSAEILEQRLDEAGYLAELPVPAESGDAAAAAAVHHRRTTTIYSASGNAVAFKHQSTDTEGEGR